MGECSAITRKGAPCAIYAMAGKPFCHYHDPNGKWMQQHPRAVARIRARTEEASGEAVAVLFDIPIDAPVREVKQPPSPSVRVAQAGDTRVYTDGACSPNPGRGGWGWVVEGGSRSGSGGEEWSTNQRMEVQAALEALKAIDGPVTIVSDSRYVVDCFQKNWWVKWLRNNWMRGKDNLEPVKNADLWRPLVALVRARGDVSFEWVKGHAGDEWNEAADALAVAAVPGGYEPPWAHREFYG